MEKTKILELSHNIFCLSHRISERVAKKYQISQIEVNILTSVHEQSETATATAINRAKRMKKNTISIHVENLVNLGLLTRGKKKGDRRVVSLILTKEGNEIASEFLKEGEKLRKNLIKGLTSDELKFIRNIVDKVNENAKELLTI